MPITNELKSLNRLEAAGFTHRQAKAIVEVTEEGQQDGFTRFVEVLHTELQTFKAEYRAELHAMRAELLKDQRDQVLRFAALVTFIVSLVGALIGAALKWL
jgi:DNA-binding transcriptional MerR regulator